MRIAIIGAGPSGLAAATRLVEDKKSVIIFEKSSLVGGLSKTINYKGNRFDLGGHRFFTNSKRVNALWNSTLGPDFLTRFRFSRIYYQDKFFSYPIKLSNALFNLGIVTSIGILWSYFLIQLFPYKREDTFEEWVSNRFGKKLFQIFFKSYTEKVWGRPCSQIGSEWAAQRIQGLSLTTTIKNAVLPNKHKKIKTLLDKFQYPKFGPGMMYEKMAENTIVKGGEIYKERSVVKIFHEDFAVTAIATKAKESEQKFNIDHLLSSMPLTELIKSLSPSAPINVQEAAEKLTYRSLITINVVLEASIEFSDTWIYIHSPEIKLGRIQNFKNWSPDMVVDKSITTLGLEFFCSEGDSLWSMPDSELINLGLSELEKTGLGKKIDFIDGFVARVPKAYPIYSQNYKENVNILLNYLGQFENMQTIGRNGLFKYDNMDTAMESGLDAAEKILNL